jgi:hypothetical protein
VFLDTTYGSESGEYSGQFKHGAKDGEGTYKWKDGSTYTGGWKANQIHGVGVHTWADGRVYTGSWAAGKMHGVGIYTWSDHKSYEGEYVKDKKEGYGKYSWPDGRVYRGYWKDGKQHGLGEYTISSEGFPQTQTRYGLWVNGSRKHWFQILADVDVSSQLDAIEESIFLEQKQEMAQGEATAKLERMTFKKPPKF